MSDVKDVEFAHPIRGVQMIPTARRDILAEQVVHKVTGTPGEVSNLWIVDVVQQGQVVAQDVVQRVAARREFGPWLLGVLHQLINASGGVPQGTAGNN